MRTALVLLALQCGCASLPSITVTPDASQRQTTEAACLRAFPSGYWKATHSIDATMPLGNNALMLGVTAHQPEGLRTVVLSPEGVALFDATSAEGKLKVERAVPPFNRTGFAEGLVDDVSHSLIPPRGAATEVGVYETGEAVCRWRGAEERITDVVLSAAQPRAIRNYRGTGLLREITIVGEAADGWYLELKMRVPGAGGYTLDMKLIDHE